MDEETLLDTDKRAKEIEQEYLSSLADLNFNSKPLINMLTILAEENLEYAQIIVAAVEKHLAKVVPDVKLPILYLVDSIVKNVGKQYKTLFSQVIVNMFCGVFEMVNEKVREKMFNLRQTWGEVFPPPKMYALDIKINSMDPGWPITAQLKPKIHINPMFLHATTPDSSMHQQLKDKHRELLQLQARKLELELLATKRRIEEQEKQLSLQTASVAKEALPEVRKATESSGSSQTTSTSAAPPVTLTKSRIAPVPQAMINMVKTRDPRLAKQQAAAQMAGPLGMASATGHSLGPMSVPPPALVAAHTMEAPNHVPSKAGGGSPLSVKDRLGARMRRAELATGRSDTAAEDGRSKKQSSLSSGAGGRHPSKSRHDQDVKPRKERKAHSSSSSSASASSSGSSARGGSASAAKASSSSASRAGGGSEKRKQRTHSNSEGSPQGRKSPHSPGKKKLSSVASDKPNHHSASEGPAKGGASESKSRSEGKAASNDRSERGSSRQVRRNSTEGKKHDHHHHPAGGDVVSNIVDVQDVDLRFSIPEKRIKMDAESVPDEGRRSVDAEEKVSLVGHKAAQNVKNMSTTEEEEAVSAMIAKDIDLRSMSLHLLPSKRTSKEFDSELVNTPATSRVAKEAPSQHRDDDDEDPDEYNTGAKKRSSSTHNRSDEPIAKKSKAEMIDALFGNEDVDLRQLPIDASVLVEGAPAMLSIEGQEANFPKLDNVLDTARSPLLEKNGGNRMDLIRGKLSCDSAKSHEKDKLGRPLLYNKLPDDPIERRRSISSLAKPGDIDLRHLAPHHDGIALGPDDEDNSMDSMNSNIKTIIAQAQEQMEKGEITPEQYNILMKQVIQLNETQKIRQAQRIEHGKQQQQQNEPTVIRIDDNGSQSGEDDVIVTSVTPATGPSAAGGAMVNDFRGKIHPMVDGGGGVGGPSQQPPAALAKPFDVVPPFGGTGVPITSVPPPDIRVQRDPRRQRESKWNRVEPSTGAGWPNRPGAVVPASPMVVAGGGAGTLPPAGAMRTGPGMAVPSPWEKAPFPVAGTTRFSVPPILQPPIGIGAAPSVGVSPAANGVGGGLMQNALSKINDSVRTINIDGIQREIRFYEETAVIFMNWDEPKEIGFQKGARMVVVDGRETFELGFNEPYKSVSIDNKVYQMRLGAPTRELYIDDSWYECYFGDAPTSIFLDGKLRIFNIAGPAPQVKIGGNRNDLVAGKINMIVDAEYIIPVFLDCKVQTFEINGHAHTLQFADFLLTVLIDDHPYPVDFGKLPKVYRLRGRDYYVRFTTLPNNVKPGKVYIRDMIRTPLYRDLRTPPKDPGALVPPLPPPSATGGNLPFAPPGGPALGLPPPSVGGGAFGGGLGNKNNHPAKAGGHPSHPPPGSANSSMSVGLDYLTNLMPSGNSVGPGGNNSSTSSMSGYRIEADDNKPSSSGGGGIPLLANINVEELYKKIVAAGIITKLGAGGGSSNTAGGAGAGDPAAGSSSSSSSAGGAGGKDGKDEQASAAGAKGTKDSKDTKPALPPIDPVQLDKSESLKKRQAAIVHQLFSGMQCSSCGVRFPPEQTMKYSQHLDWHFRQNRRDRDSARKAHSRKWYYDVSDWIQYEEIEDLEEREKNWFETQQSEQGGDLRKGMGGAGGHGGGHGAGGVGGGGGDGGFGGGGGGDDSCTNGDGVPQPSCPAGSEEDDRQCHMCHEVFEQFYNEETEDWHLKCAIRVEGSTYHPLCYEDYKASLTMSETTLADDSSALDESRKTDSTTSTKKGGDDGDEDDVMGGEEDESGEARGAADGADASSNRTTTPRKRPANSSKIGKADEEDDDDDDVIVLPAVEPVVEEILDDDAEEEGERRVIEENTPAADVIADEDESSQAATKSPSAPRQPEFQERQIDEDLFIQEPNIEVTDVDELEDTPAVGAAAGATDGSAQSTSVGAGEAADGENSLSSLLLVKIKEEPKEEDEADEEDALFEDVGTIESSVLEIVDDHRSPTDTAATADEAGADLLEDVIVESIPSPGAESSNQMAIQPTPGGAQKPSLDGNVDLQDAQQAAPVLPNRIKINITKSKAAALQNNNAAHGAAAGASEGGDAPAGAGEGGSGAFVNSNFSENSHGGASDPTEEGGSGAALFDELSNDASGSWGDEGDQNGINNGRTTAAGAEPAKVAFEETTNVTYERKPALTGIEFNRCPRVTSGSEASGLCSIM